MIPTIHTPAISEQYLEINPLGPLNSVRQFMSVRYSSANYHMFLHNLAAHDTSKRITAAI